MDSVPTEERVVTTYTESDPPPHRVVLDLELIVPVEDGWEGSRALEVVNCLRNIAKSDGGHGQTWRARVCDRIADQIEAQAGGL